MNQGPPGPQSLVAIVASIRAGSVVAWQHITRHREYDFAGEKLEDSVGLEAPKIRQLAGS